MNCLYYLQCDWFGSDDSDEYKMFLFKEITEMAFFGGSFFQGDDGSKDKKMRGFPAEEEESKITQQSSNTSKGNCSKRETSACSSKEKSKASEVQKTDYIHVRARRGQATDSHSLAERVRWPHLPSGKSRFRLGKLSCQAYSATFFKWKTSSEV